MKRLSVVLLLLFTVFLLGGCGETSKVNKELFTTPTGVSGLFGGALERGNSEEAKKFLFEDTNVTSFDLTEMSEIFSKKNPGVVINDSQRAEITGDTAIVPLYWTDLNVKELYVIRLAKRNGLWKITSVTKR